MDENSPDDNEVWTPPESTQEPYPLGYDQPRGSSYQSNAVYSSSQLTFPSSSTQNVQSYSSQFIPQDFQPPDSARGLSFSEASYQITGSQSNIYQAAQSSYSRMSPSDDFRPSGSDNISYSGLGPDSGQLITGVVDSSTLQQNYPLHQVVFQGGDHRMITVQRVTSPVDTRVSQSALALQNQDDDQQPTHALLTPVPASSVRSYSMYPTHGEVSTSGQPSMISHRQDSEPDSQVSSISESLHSRLVRNVSKVEEPVSGEPDTTQEDNDDYQQHVRSYLVEENSSIDTEPVLHSTMIGTSRGAVVMDSTTDNPQLSSSQISHYSREVESSADSSLAGDIVTNGPTQSSVSVNMSGMVTVEGLDSTLDDDDKGQLTSNLTMPTIINVSVRKSNRIAEMENDLPSYQKPKYIPKPYNVNEIWCEECMTTYDVDCPTHKLALVPDKVVLSRAWASLPPMLQIFRLEDVNSQFGDAEANVGVFAKRVIPKGTQFGPFIGELVQNKEDIQSTKFLLMLERQEGDVLYFDTNDENKCNWMMFVRPAENFAEQNIVAYQHGFDIYFTVTKNIESRAELKVWYATHYARRYGLHTLEITQQDIDVLDEQECKYQCYECSKRFKTSIALQRHLITHEPGAPQPSTSTSEPQIVPSTSISSSENIVSTYSAIKKKYKPQPKKNKDFSDTSGYMWKKKSTSIYLNKTLKKYQKRHDSEAIRRTIQSMYRKKGKESGGNEWVCVHCDLTFDNSNLLNLHTLTHAAEDVGFDEVYKFAYKVNENGDFQQPGTSQQNTEMYALEPSMLACPVCHVQFNDQRALIEHAAEHGKSKTFLSATRTHKCTQCWKAFHSREKLNRHMLCHGSEENKPLQCNVCFKRFMNNSALSCHMKTHSDKKYYECPICKEGFNHSAVMREHVTVHANNGIYTCPQCGREFDDFYNLRKHIRGFHTNKEFPCPHCEKVFPRPDKLKLHMLKHSNHREFMCETCGRQFKRKDKLKEHIRRMHSAERELENLKRGDPKISPKKFVPKVAPTDYHRFIYKCHTCMLGFKRRGMLVNHLAKRHPDVKFETVPELNLPILKTQKDYYCQYCDKVYKSSSKRKTHILKNHPGAELPMSSRKKNILTELPGIPNPTFSQTVGSITTMPHLCEFCHKQYASKAKLTQHQRKKHPEKVPPLPPKPITMKQDSATDMAADVQPNQEPVQQIVRYEPADSIVTVPTDGQAADLLTQAMSELTQTVQAEYRPQTNDYQSRVAPTMVQLTHQGSTIDLSHLNHALSQGHLGQALAHAFVQPSGLGGPIQIAVSGPLTTLSQLQQPDGVHQAREVLQEEPSTTGQQLLNPQTIVVSHPQIVPVTMAPTVQSSKWNSYANYR